VPEAIVVGDDGVSAIDRRGVDSTVKVAVAVTPSSVAVMVAIPTPAAVASPFCPSVLLMVATPVFDDDQFTEEVRKRCDPSLYVPVAENC
jgi:hypothetical protein